MLANSLTDYLKTLNVVPKDYALRTGRIEASTPKAVMFMLPLGGYDELTDQGGGIYSGNQQVIVRAKDAMEVYALCEAINSALTVIGRSVEVDGYLVSQMRPRGLPVIYPVNDADLFEGSVHFTVRVVRRPI